MLYVFYGTNETAVANKRIALLTALRKKRTDVEEFVFDASTLEPSALDACVSAQGLFFQKHIIVLHGVCEKDACREILLERVEQLGTTEHVVVLSEGELDKETVKALTPHVREISEYKKVAKKQEGNPFAAVEALARKDVRGLWLSCVEQLRKGTEPEMIIGTLHWQVRMLLFAKQGVSVEDAGVSMFALQKAGQHAGTFTTEELKDLSRSLVRLYHDAHRGLFPLKTGLEKWCLEIK